MELPGGIWEDGCRRTEACLRTVTGEVELALATCAAMDDPTERVTATLDAALATIGDRPSTRERVASLCVDDRRWLMLQLSAVYGTGTWWVTDRCRHCEGAFEIPLDPASVPVKPAGDGYPFARVTTRHGWVKLRVPTGADQHAIAQLDDAEALTALLERCCVDATRDDVAQLSPADVQRISEAIEAVSPQVALTLATQCPACAEALEVSIDPYALLPADPEDIFDDVHVIAQGYGWTEPQILELPVSRRREYLQRLERDRG